MTGAGTREVRQPQHRDNLLEIVEALKPGTIFQVGAGTPWMKLSEGVADLLPLVLEAGFGISNPTPASWADMNGSLVTILFEEETR